MERMTVVFHKNYNGFESLQDYHRDISEAIDSDFNPVMKMIPGEFKGTISVTIIYEHKED
jgi:hypothetical protein